MKNFNEIKSELNSLFSQNFDGDCIISVMLFGSSVQESLSSESDIDVAILFDPLLDKDRQDELIYQIFKKIPYYFIEPVDLVNLNQANFFLSYQILSKGETIDCKNEREFKLFRDTRLLQYLDFKKFLQPYYPKMSLKLRGKV